MSYEKKIDEIKLETVCVGIGGRGVLLASTVLIEAAVDAGYDAMASDEYGMSQRGGSVVSLIKVGPFSSPLVGRGEADLLLAFEESEFYRNLPFLKKGGFALVNTSKTRLPESVEKLISKQKFDCHLVDADNFASSHGMVKSANMVVLGYLSAFGIDPYTRTKIEGTIKRKISRKFMSKNLDVFQEAYKDGRRRCKQVLNDPWVERTEKVMQ